MGGSGAARVPAAAASFARVGVRRFLWKFRGMPDVAEWRRRDWLVAAGRGGEDGRGAGYPVGRMGAHCLYGPFYAILIVACELDRRRSPIACVCPQMKKDGLEEKARMSEAETRSHGLSSFLLGQ